MAHRSGLSVVAAVMLLVTSCSGAESQRQHTFTAAPSPGAVGTLPARGATPVSAVGCDSPRLSDQEWARCALAVLNLVNVGVKDYHAATALPRYSLRAQDLQQQAFQEFNEALTAHQSLWSATQQVHNTQLRDQYVFVLGNIGGFMNPTPDLPGDPNGPTLGDRVARSLQNAITTTGILQPQLEKLAAEG
jgi:hypothetical protein